MARKLRHLSTAFYTLERGGLRPDFLVKKNANEISDRFLKYRPKITALLIGNYGVIVWENSPESA